MDRPNILFILADQLRPDFLGYNGFRAIATPYLDRLASESVCYDAAISACPICVPARAALLTGLSSLKTGVISNQCWLRPDRRELGIASWPELLGEVGYETLAIGKMHFTPWDAHEGFHRRVIAEDKRWPLIRDDYHAFLEKRGLRKRFATEDPSYRTRYGAIVGHLPVDATVDRFVTDQATDALRRRNRSQPFAMMVGYPSPHCPYDPAPEYLAQVDPAALPPCVPDDWEGPGKQILYQGFLKGMREAWHQIDYARFPAEAKQAIRTHYAALVKQLDDEVGRLLRTLREEGLDRDTVVVFTSDHGDFVGDRGLVGKKMFYEPSIRIPLLVRLPGHSEGRRCGDLVELHDLAATLLHLAGVRPPPFLDSIPLPHLGIAGPSRTHATGFLQGQAFIRRGPWKLTRYAGGLRELFHLEEDPDEQHNRILDPGTRPVVDQLENLLWQSVFADTAFASSHLIYESAQGRYLDEDFSRRGWPRPYPRRLAEAGV